MSEPTSKARILFVVSAVLAKPEAAYSTPAPRKDYTAFAELTGATLLDRGQVNRFRAARWLSRLIGAAPVQAWLAFRQRGRFDAIITDGEHLGIPLALLLKVTHARVAHVTIGHRITASKKRPFFRWLKVHTHIHRICVHSSRQHELAIRELNISAQQIALIPYQVDVNFWHPLPIAEERMICSAGLEFRDYPTLVNAVGGLDVNVIVGAASPWSKRRNSAADVAPPQNVTVSAFGYTALRDLYARAAIVVVPLDDTDFQAGITTILEAMAVGKAVVVTHSLGQTDVVEDRRATTRGQVPRSRHLSLLRDLARSAGMNIEPNGFYVPPADPYALRNAIVYLLDHPEERARMGAAGRRTVEHLMTVEQFAMRLLALVEEARGIAEPAETPQVAARSSIAQADSIQAAG